MLRRSVNSLENPWSQLLSILSYCRCPRSMRSRVYVTVGRQSVRPSVRLSHHSTEVAACGGFAAEHHAAVRAGDVDRQQRRCSTALINNAGSAALTAEFMRRTDLLATSPTNPLLQTKASFTSHEVKFADSSVNSNIGICVFRTE